ncbi:unnamed protein product [Mycena citricolor]|uniref:YTH domain-containing protein n=1 Tax=Mycena citricolor TaxID=2018698 RepID=A0AAD2HXT2_9AGAR|nr:unnamed protein product [Mycena citricolor]
MDPDAQYWQQIVGTMEEEMVRDNNKQMMVALGLIGFGYAEAKRQKPNRLYMCWPQIPPNSCVNTPWKAMYVNGSDRAFITTMGIDTDMFSRERCRTREALDRCAADGAWYIQKHNQVVLDQAFRTSQETILFFSVNKSGQFYGYAKMMSPVAPTISIGPDPMADDTNAGDESPGLVVRVTTPYCLENSITLEPVSIDPSAPGDHPCRLRSNLGLIPSSTSNLSRLTFNDPALSEGQLRPAPELSGQFTVEWLCWEPLPFKRTRGIINSWNRGREIKISRDGTELEPSAGGALIEVWKSWLTEPSRHRRR